jgi:hypothetical protein
MSISSIFIRRIKERNWEAQKEERYKLLQKLKGIHEAGFVSYGGSQKGAAAGKSWKSKLLVICSIFLKWE